MPKILGVVPCVYNPALGRPKWDDPCSSLLATPSLLSEVLMREHVLKNRMDVCMEHLSLTSGLHLRSWAFKEAT